MNKKHTCCILGHRTTTKTEKLKQQLCKIIENLVLSENVDTFLFGSRSDFNDFCHDVVTAVKEKHPHIKRIYVRAEYPYINEYYRSYLLENYDDTYYPEKIIGSGRAVYIRRNYEMINSSDFCIIYYDEHYSPPNRKSGTKIALDYALKKRKRVIKLPI